MGGQAFPIEHKVGKRRTWDHDDIQLAAQAMCLEDMLGVPVPAGAVYYRASRRRREVAVDEALRSAVSNAVAGVRSMMATDMLADPVNDARCPHCSLMDACLPDVVAHPRRVQMYRAELFRAEGVD
jgi:CRISPR-associated exonuclease Cas4